MADDPNQPEQKNPDQKSSAPIDPGPPPDPNEVNPNATPVQQQVKIPLGAHAGKEIVDNSRKAKFFRKLEKFKKPVLIVFEFVRSPIGSFQDLEATQKLKVTSMILILVLLGLLAKYWKTDWEQYFQPDIMNSLEPKATQVIEIDPNEPNIDFDQSLLVPQYIVLMNKVVVNLKRSASSGENPMAAFNIYLQTSNQETSIEIKNRERELQDFVQRTTEGLSYDQLLSENGKLKWKLALKSELNMVLTQGKIKNIYFKTLLIKP